MSAKGLQHGRMGMYVPGDISRGGDSVLAHTRVSCWFSSIEEVEILTFEYIVLSTAYIQTLHGLRVVSDSLPEFRVK